GRDDPRPRGGPRGRFPRGRPPDDEAGGLPPPAGGGAGPPLGRGLPARPPADRPLGEGRGDPLAERLHPLHSPAPGGNLLAWPGSRSSSSAPSRRRTSG